MNLFRTGEEMENLLKSYQAAEMLSISLTTFNRLVNEGKIEYIAIGKRGRRFTQEAINDFRERETKWKQ